ncbi:MAG: hypothetical protein LUD12_07240 [Lachnospiraceae bacterium]|nr:hypothetical protein [Lachnospiraceae bacterium]
MLYDGFGSEGVPGEEAENRLRNLMWTISGDYALDTKLDVESYERSKYISLYDAVKQGAFARFYDKNAFALYLVKKVYCGAEERPLTELAQLCVDAASYRRIAEERPGVPELRDRAFSDLLEDSFHRMSATLPGRIKIAFMKNSLYGDEGGEKQVRESVRKLLTLENPVLKNAQYVNARRYAEKNKVHFQNNRNRIARNVEQLSDELRRSLNRRSEPERQTAYAGTIKPRLLWKVGRMETPGRLFEKTLRRSNSDFAVNILIDASGSQRDRQSDVAMQAYILAEALAINHIPLQITSFCTFWDYTVLQRFREYDAPREENRRLLEEDSANF